MKQREFTSIGFILALTILLLNDFYFKIYYGNWLTGKLSDFAGLFVFPLFWTILFPKLKDKIYFASAIIFIYWKTVYSETLLEIINQLSIIKLNRVVDFKQVFE